jgi:hypothetical protein
VVVLSHYVISSLLRIVELSHYKQVTVELSIREVCWMHIELINSFTKRNDISIACSRITVSYGKVPVSNISLDGYTDQNLRWFSSVSAHNFWNGNYKPATTVLFLGLFFSPRFCEHGYTDHVYEDNTTVKIRVDGYVRFHEYFC